MDTPCKGYAVSMGESDEQDKRNRCELASDAVLCYNMSRKIVVAPAVLVTPRSRDERKCKVSSMSNIVPQHASFEQSSRVCLVCGSNKDILKRRYGIGRGGKKSDHGYRYLCVRCDVSGKFCSLCQVYKSYAEYPHAGGRGGRGNYCLACVSIRSKEKYKEICKEHGGKPQDIRDNQRKWHLYRTFGLTEDEYLAMFQRQMGLCAICGKPETRTNKFGEVYNLAIDHCHQTNLVRELLCHACNQMLGHARDNAEVLKKAMKYLKKHAS